MISHSASVTRPKSVDVVKSESLHSSGEISLPSSEIEEGYQVKRFCLNKFVWVFLYAKE